MPLIDQIVSQHAKPVDTTGVANSFGEGITQGIAISKRREELAAQRQELEFKKLQLEQTKDEKEMEILFKASTTKDPALQKALAEEWTLFREGRGKRTNPTVMKLIGKSTELSQAINYAYNAAKNGDPEAKTFLQSFTDLTVSEAYSAATKLLRNEAYQKAVNAGAANRASGLDLRTDQLRLAFQKDLDAKFDKVGKTLDGSEAMFQNLKTVFASGDPIQIKSVIGQYARAVSGENGVLTEGDAARALQMTLGGDLASKIAYIFGEGQLPEGQVKKLTSNLDLFQANLRKVTRERIGRMEREFGNSAGAPYIGDYAKGRFEEFKKRLPEGPKQMSPGGLNQLRTLIPDLKRRNEYLKNQGYGPDNEGA